MDVSGDGSSEQDKGTAGGRGKKTQRAARGAPAVVPSSTLGFPSAQPSMAPTARRLLEAARRLLERSGYNSLSVQAIGEEAGENKALIRYYFGDKNGLLVALVDWLMYDTLWEVHQRLAKLSQERDRLGVLIDDAAAGMLADTQSYRSYFDLLPHLLANPKMARQLSELLQAYRDMNVRGLWGERDGVPDVVKDLAALTVAMVDGLAIQVLAEPDKVDVPRALAVWKSFVEQTISAAQVAAREEASG